MNRRGFVAIAGILLAVCGAIWGYQTGKHAADRWYAEHWLKFPQLPLCDWGIKIQDIPAGYCLRTGKDGAIEAYFCGRVVPK